MVSLNAFHIPNLELQIIISEVLVRTLIYSVWQRQRGVSFSYWIYYWPFFHPAECTSLG